MKREEGATEERSELLQQLTTTIRTKAGKERQPSYRRRRGVGGR